MRKIYAVIILLLICHAISLAQNVTIRGQVKGLGDSPVPAATVVARGTKTTTMTDEKGEFSITVPALPARLVFSAIGHDTKVLLVKKADSAKYLSIRLQPSEQLLSEVVVVGYGSSKRMDVTGSVAVIDGSFSASSSRRRGEELRSRETGSPRTVPEEKKAEISRATGGSTRDPASKILTAGELSDFKKWKLWEDYSKSEFSQWSEHWGIKPVKRICLQVQNGDRKAMVGQKAFLINLNTNDTVWRAITDNTGKAELWADFRSGENDQSTYAIACGDQTLRFPVVFENGINRITLKKSCAQVSAADIAFVVDATGSMGDEIKYMQEELQDVIAHVAAKNKGVQLRTGAVFYRDHSDEYLTRTQDFQPEPSSLINFIKQQSAAGGGDVPEAVEDALTAALDSLHWDTNARAKILFLILDAPPHDAAKDKMKELLTRAAGMGIRIVPVVCSGIDKSAEYLMRSMALATNGSYVFLTDDSGVGDKHIKPTTDNFTVELLNDLMQRVIAEMIYTPPCDDKEKLMEANCAENNFANITVYPNPSVGKINIRSPEAIKELFITDFAGKILERINTGSKAQNWQIDLASYPSGTYLVRYFTEQKGWGIKKVLLMK